MPKGRHRNLAGAAFFAAFTLALAGGAALSAYETASLTLAWKPITQRTRETWHDHPRWVAPAIFGLGALFAHLFWGPPDRERDDEAP